MKTVCELYDRIIDKNLLVRRINITGCRVLSEKEARDASPYEQIDIFSILDEQKEKESEEELKKEKKIQETLIDIKRKFGKNAILKGMNLEEGATAKDRNSQIGGHKA
jgi:DNA polymerase V